MVIVILSGHQAFPWQSTGSHSLVSGMGCVAITTLSHVRGLPACTAPVSMHVAGCCKWYAHVVFCLT